MLRTWQPSWRGKLDNLPASSQLRHPVFHHIATYDISNSWWDGRHATSNSLTPTGRSVLLSLGQRGDGNRVGIVLCAIQYQSHMQRASQLTMTLKECWSVQQLDECVSQHREDMNHIHVSAALSRLAKLPHANTTGRALMLQLSHMLLEPTHASKGTARLSALDSRGVSNTVWALAKGGLADSRAFHHLLNLVRQDVGTSMVGYEAQHIANIMWACATAGSLDAHLAQRLCGHVFGRGLQSFKAQELSNILWACATAGALHPPFAQQLCAHVAGRELREFEPQALSNILWALATAGLLQAAFAERMCRHIERSDLATFQPQALASTLWACATADVLEPAFADRLCRHVASTDLHAYQPQQLSSILWACATAAVLQPSFAQRLCSHIAAMDLQHLSPQGICNIVWACATAEHYNQRLLDALAARALLPGGMAGAVPQTWANMLWGYSKLRHSSPTLFAGAVALMQPTLPQFAAQDLANVLSAYAIAAPPAALAALLDALQPHVVVKLPTFSEYDLCNTAWALAVAGDWGDGRDSAGTVRTHMVLAVLEEVCRRDAAALPDDGLCLLHQLVLALQVGGDRGNLGHVWRDGVLSCAAWVKVARRARGAWDASIRAATTSSKCQEIFDMMRAMGLDVRLEQLSPCGNYSVDLVVALPTPGAGGSRRRHVVPVEVDGPFHFMQNCQGLPDGATRLRNRRLEHSYGVPVVSINLQLQGPGRREYQDWGDPHCRVGQARLRRLLGIA